MIFAGMDIETTGFLTPDHRIVEIYIGLWRDKKLIFEYETRIDPMRASSEEAHRVHGISGADLIGKPKFEQVAPMIAKVLSKCNHAVAHNGLEFDMEFIKQEMKRVGVAVPNPPVFDTMHEGVWATGDGKKPNLEQLCFACGVEYDRALAHAASYDVHQMMECFYKALDWGFFKIDKAF